MISRECIEELKGLSYDELGQLLLSYDAYVQAITELNDEEWEQAEKCVNEYGEFYYLPEIVFPLPLEKFYKEQRDKAQQPTPVYDDKGIDTNEKN